MAASEPAANPTSPPAVQPGGIFRDPLQIQAFLERTLKRPVRDLEILPAGWNTRILAFKADDQALVLRLSTHAESIAKERKAQLVFAPRLPVPQVWCEGRQGPLFWAVVQRCPGVALTTYSQRSQLHFSPQVMTLLRALLETPLPVVQPAAGILPVAEPRPVKNWTAHLRALHGMRPRLSQMAHPTAWLTPARLEQLLTAFDAGVPMCPTTPLWWLHGDFKAANLIAESGQITGVIDWSGLGHGDFLYDAAMWFWHQPHTAWPQWWPFFRALYQDLALDLTDAETRLETYLLHTGLGTLVTLVSIPHLHPHLPFYEAQLEALLRGELKACLVQK